MSGTIHSDPPRAPARETLPGGPCPCGLTHDDEDPRRKFYVSAIDGDAFVFLDGPFDTHAAALAAVEPARDLAQEVDPRACWYAYGTARAPAGYEKPGLFTNPNRIGSRP